MVRVHDTTCEPIYWNRGGPWAVSRIRWTHGNSYMALGLLSSLHSYVSKCASCLQKNSFVFCLNLLLLFSSSTKVMLRTIFSVLLELSSTHPLYSHLLHWFRFIYSLISKFEFAK